MKVLGIIPARYGSSRFPGKPLIDLKGKSMIQRVYEGAKACDLLTSLVVATDDERIYHHVKSFDGEVVMTRIDHLNGTERCGEVTEKYSDYDVVINIQGDEPLINPLQIGLLIQQFEKSNVEIATIAKKIVDLNDIRNPNRIKVVLDKDNFALYFSRSPIPHVAQVVHEEWLNHAVFFKHIGLYAWRLETFKAILKLPPVALENIESLEQLRWLYNGYKIKCVVTDLDTPNVDVPEDVQNVLALL